MNFVIFFISILLFFEESLSSVIKNDGELKIRNNLFSHQLEMLEENSEFKCDYLKSNIFIANLAEINETASEKIWTKHIYPLSDKPIEVFKQI